MVWFEKTENEMENESESESEMCSDVICEYKGVKKGEESER